MIYGGPLTVSRAASTFGLALIAISPRITKRTAPAMSALDRQEGGSHYKEWPIQPVEFLEENSAFLTWAQSNIIKYVCRFRDKNGIEDLRKARHYLDILEEYEYGNREKP